MHIQNLMKYSPFVLKIFLTPIKGHNSVTNVQNMTGNNPKIYLVNIDEYNIQNLMKFCSFVLKISSGNTILTLIQGRYGR